MKKINKKLFHAFMALLLVLSVVLPSLRSSYVVEAAEIPSTNYTMTTVPTINNNPLISGRQYGEGKFYISPTYKFADSATLENGDFIEYHVPNEFQIERDTTTDIFGKDGATKIAELTTNKAENKATVTITNAEYFKNLSENKELTALFTVVWAKHVQLNKEYSIDIPGAGNYKLTRIVPDDDPTGFTKWGVQDADDPNYVNWRIRINRYVRSITDVRIEDTIPEGQVLASSITGYYFTEWNKEEPRPALNAAHVTVNNPNSFTIVPNGNGDLSSQGLYVLYRTRLTAPVDNVTKKAFNKVKVSTSEGNYDVDGFAALTTTEGIGSGSQSDEVEFAITKKLDGGTLKGNDFTFQLIDVATGEIKGTAKNDQEGKVKFDKIKFSSTGTFNYQIKEVDEKAPGVTYDKTVINAKVTVEDVYGAKIASVKYDKKVLTNTYSLLPTKATITAKKVLNGSTLADDQFEFELKEGTEVVGTAKNKADGTVTFPDLNYAEVGTHTYTITEKAGTAPGVTYDSTSRTVTVDVKDNGQGQLVATVNDNNPTFTNTYTAAATTATISAKKVLNGKALEADKYEFELKEGNKVVATAKNAADGTVTFPAISYDAAGPHTYTITEKAGSEAGVTYDKTSHTVTVDVKDDGQGQLVATVTGNNPTFTNTYKAATASATITSKKELTGKALEADKYEFELKEGNNVVATAKNKADGTVTFPAISYDAVGTHTYTITEKAGSEAGVTYDTNSHTVTVEVVDNGQGQLVATPTGNNPTFTNTYKAAATTATVKAKKVLTGKALEADKYEFELKEGDTVVGTAKNAADGSVNFPAISYDAAGTYTYTVTEKAGSEAGVTYDTNSHEVTVEVKDNGQGQLVATVKGEAPVFTNTYKAAATSANVTATKVLTGKVLEADKYEFELKEGNKVVATAKNAADGSVNFPAISYAAAGTHTYTITEKAGTEGGVTYDKTSHTVTVDVKDDGQGQLVATVNGDNPTFTNAYKASAVKATIGAKKVLDGKALEADKYEFELKQGDTVVATAKNAADGTVTFPAIQYTEAGVHAYTITEKAGTEGGVTYDTTSYNVTVGVVDNGQGQLVTTVTGNNPTFTNTYAAKSVKETIGAQKVLKGKDLEADKYEFELKEGDKVVATAKNAADGTVAFPAIEYTAAGTYTYTITEKAGSEANVTYDNASHTVTVEVVDNGQGQLVTTVTGNNPTFTNVYTAPTPTKGPKPKEDPKKGLPKTGTTDMSLFSSLVALVLFGLSAFVYRAKKVD